MLQLSNALLNKPVLSLRTGTPVATVTAPIINPNSLKIEGFYCHDSRSHDQLVLVYQDIRDLIPQGFVVDDHDVLVAPGELIRMKKLFELNFELLGKQVETTDKKKLGKVGDYATEITTMYIQKLYVTQSVFKNFTGGSLSVDRTQISEITDKRIIIHDISGKVPAHANAMA
jgi:sporulation protein YlmC with PRC-barrel domain